MVIGVSEKNGAISQHLLNLKNRAYIDVDVLLNQILTLEFDSGIDFVMSHKLQKSKINALLELRIIEELEKHSDSEDVIIKYSMLSDLKLFDELDLAIEAVGEKTDSENNTIMASYIANHQSKDFNRRNKYQLSLNMEENWKNKLDEYFSQNVNNETLVSIVVPIYNTSDCLIRCVESITKQTYRNIEILLINDGSTDNSLEICEQLSKKDSRIRIISQENKGLAEARNTGVLNAKGEYICFVDSDDFIDFSMVDELLKKIIETNSDVCECSFYIHQRNGSVKDVTVEQKGNRFIRGRLNLINAYSDATILIPAWDKMYRASVLKDIKFTNECFKEDSDFIYRLCLAGKSFSLVAKPLYHYIKRNGKSITASKFSPELFTLKEWGERKYLELISYGVEFTDAAEKVLYNSLTHILRYFMRDYKNGVLLNGEYQEEIQEIVNSITRLLFSANNISKFRKLDEILDIINFLIDEGVLEREKFPTLTIPCIGIIWNSMSYEQKIEAIEILKKKQI